jgi:hypothetical protein
MPKFAFCEHTTAGSRTPWHIRIVGPEGLKLGGGCPAPLCRTYDRWINGWDMATPVSERFLVYACQECVAKYRKLVKT